MGRPLVFAFVVWGENTVPVPHTCRTDIDIGPDAPEEGEEGWARQGVPPSNALTRETPT